MKRKTARVRKGERDKTASKKPAVPLGSMFTWEPEKEVTAWHEQNPILNE